MADGIGRSTVGAEALLELRCATGTSLAQAEARARQLITEAGTRIVGTRASEHRVSFVLAESTAFVTASSIVLLTCHGARLDRAFARALEDERAPAVRFVRFAPESRTELRVGALREAERLVDGTAAGIDTTSGCVSVGRGRGFSAIRHLRAVGLNGTLAADLRRAPVHAVDELFADSGLLLAEFHDHRFEPVGYSRNAFIARGSIAVHVSPEGPAPEATVLAVDLDPPLADALERGFKAWTGLRADRVELPELGGSRC